MRLRWFLLGALSLLAIAGIGAAVVLRNAGGFGARQQPSAMGARFVTPCSPICGRSQPTPGPASMPRPTPASALAKAMARLGEPLRDLSCQ